MAGSKTCWINANHEGKKLRETFNKLFRKFKSTNDLDELVRIAHAMNQVALAKNSLAKTNELQKRLENVEEKLGVK